MPTLPSRRRKKETLKKLGSSAASCILLRLGASMPRRKLLVASARCATKSSDYAKTRKPRHVETPERLLLSFGNFLQTKQSFSKRLTICLASATPYVMQYTIELPKQGAHALSLT